MYLLIDYRENDFINKLSEFTIIENNIVKTVKINNIDIKIKITNLEIGDFIIQQSIDDMNSILLCVERKTKSDLSASIKDSRFREQKVRLIESLQDHNKICYIIENNLNNNRNLSDNILTGAILNLIFKHNFKVINTKNISDTFNQVLLLYKKFINKDFINNNVLPISLIKKSNKLQSSKITNQLCLITGVSNIIAESIIEHVKTVIGSNIPITIKILIEMYNKLETEKEKESMFSEIYIKNSKNNRKIGKALSKKIYEYFCL